MRHLPVNTLPSHSFPQSDDGSAPALKEIFNLERLAHIAHETRQVYPAFDQARFLASAGHELDSLSLMQRLRRVSECLHQGLPQDFTVALPMLQSIAPRLNSRFVTLILPEYVARYGLAHFELAMQGLKFLTRFGTAEFAVRHFLRQDMARALEIMTAWSRDDNEHVRRLASEGSRPRLPWSFRLEPLVADPQPAAAILENLKADPSLYVRKSVANHLNDITKDHPDWVLARVAQWDLARPETAWIVKHALRTLIKKGDRRALAVVGAGHTAQVRLHEVSITPQSLRLGDRLVLSFVLESTGSGPQRLVVDYAIHYMKQNGKTSAKVFKLKTLTLAEGERLRITRQQHIRDFTTRVHHAGRHGVDILVNGDCLAQTFFQLAKP